MSYRLLRRTAKTNYVIRWKISYMLVPFHLSAPLSRSEKFQPSWKNKMLALCVSECHRVSYQHYYITCHIMFRLHVYEQICRKFVSTKLMDILSEATVWEVVKHLLVRDHWIFEQETTVLESILTFVSMKPLHMFNKRPLFETVFQHLLALSHWKFLTKVHCLRRPFKKRPLFKMAL